MSGTKPAADPHVRESLRRPFDRCGPVRLAGLSATELDPVHEAADACDMSDSHRTQLLRFCTAIGVLGVVLAFGWVLQPTGIEAAGLQRREVVEDIQSKAPSLGTLHGRDLVVQMLAGASGPRYQVLDEGGLVLGVYDSQPEMTAALEQLGGRELRAEVSDLLLQDP